MEFRQSRDGHDSRTIFLIDRLDRIAVAIEALAKPAARQSPASPFDVTISRESEAILWVLQTRTIKRSEIAARFGVSTRTVQRWKHLREVIDSLTITGSAGSPPDGKI